MQTIDWTNGETQYAEDVAALQAALEAAREVTDRPSFISLRTIIGWPAPKKQGTGKAHGSALGDDEIKATKQLLGFDPEQTFEVSDEVIAHTRGLRDRGAQAQAEWEKSFQSWAEANPEGKALYDRFVADELSPGWEEALPSWDADPKGVATRAASGKVLTALAPKMPELWGGSADLAESNNTTPEGEPSFLPTDRQTKAFSGGPYGRVLHFGIREHAMGAILNGIKVHGGTRPYGGTFLTFSDYMRGAVRLSALMRVPVTYVWTHDSIGLGEDGPTHQPVEHLAALRAIPGLDVVRPADANETAACWAAILRNKDRPAGLILSRQNLPIVPRGQDGFADTSGVAKGGYVLKDFGSADAEQFVILIGTGSEVQYAVTRRRAAGDGGHRGARRLHALPRVVRRAGRGIPQLGDPAGPQGSGQRRGRGQHGLARPRRRRRTDHQHQPLRRQRLRREAVRGVRLQRGHRARRRQGQPRGGSVRRRSHPRRRERPQGAGGPGVRPGRHDQLSPER